MFLPSSWRLKNPKVLKNLALFLVAGIAALFVIFRIPSADGKLHLYFLDVGQGDSALITTPKAKYALVDGGPDNKVITELSKSIPFYRRDIELVVLTHPHADHLVGLVEVLKRYEVKNIVETGVSYESEIYEEWKELVLEEKANVTNVYAGDKFRLDGVLFEVLWPTDKSVLEYYAARDINNTSIVLLLRHGTFSVLLSGDANKEVQDKINFTEAADVFKAPHHGSFSAFNVGLLEVIEPKLIVISVGKNSFGHPSPQVLGEAAKRGTSVLRTDKFGTIEVISDGKVWRAR